MRDLLCRLGRHVITDFSVNSHWHEDGTLWMSLVCANCFKRLDHHKVPTRMYEHDEPLEPHAT